MVICVNVNGTRRCYHIPRFRVPLEAPQEPLSGSYSTLMTDATLVSTITDLASRVSEARVSKALRTGINAAVKVLQTQAGEGVEIHLEPPPG